MLWNLKRSGKLSKLAGLVVGGFNKLKPDDPGEEFGRTTYEMVLGVTKEYNYPVCFDFPVGHQKNNVALKCGVKHKLMVSSAKCTLTEMR
jgi:muramoyltetrapeptide carboxypeptidase